MDEENYKEAVDASFKVFAPRGTGKLLTPQSFFKMYPSEVCL